MGTVEVIVAILIFFISVSFFIISYLQSKEKGFLFNNAYIYATKGQRAKMNKKPYYRQSAIVFSILGLIFLLNAIDIILNTDWIIFIVICLVILVIIYAIVSSIAIGRKGK